MNSKQTILAALRAGGASPVEHPSMDEAWTTYSDRTRQFTEMVEAVGGRCLVVADLDQLHHELAQLPAYVEAKKICSQVPGVGADRANLDLEKLTDPHEAEEIEFAILPGRFGVAENAAVWVDSKAVAHRVAFFISQHLALVISYQETPDNALVNNMHEAYAKLGTENETEFTRFGLFISGPSKTADIEQSLVIGAHGARSLTVFLVRQ